MNIQLAIGTAVAHQAAGREAEAEECCSQMLSNPEPRDAIARYGNASAEQNEIYTCFDFVLMDYLNGSITPEGKVSVEALTMIDFVVRREQGRFVDFFIRKATKVRAK